MPMLLVLSCGLLVAETLLAVAVSRGLPLPMMLAWHALALAVAGACVFRRSARQSRYGLLLWLSTAAFGPLGPGGVLLAMVVERQQARSATSLAEWHASLFPPSEEGAHAALWRQVGQRGHDRPATPDVTPFLDLLQFGSVPQRQAVIGIIVQQFSPAFAPALRAALRDDHNVVRVQAATAIARIEQQFFERTVALEAAVEQAPDDAAAVLALATHFDDQAFAGLLDPAREQACRTKATEWYGRRLELEPGDRNTEFRLARLLLRRGLPNDAEPRFRRLAADGYPAATLWLMESLFAARRFDEVHAVATSTDPEEIAAMTPDVQATVGLWSGAKEAA